MKIAYLDSEVEVGLNLEIQLPFKMIEQNRDIIYAVTTLFQLKTKAR